MKKLLYPFAFALTVFFIAYSCSAEEKDTTPPPSVVKPTTPEPEPEVTQFTLTVTAGEGGTVSTEGGTYDEGTEVTITVTPAEGYEFVGWEGSDSTDTTLTLTLGANTTLNALFEAVVQYSVNIESNQGGSVSVESGLFYEGTELTIIATADEGYEFLNWEGIDEGESSEITITVNSDITINAIFKPFYVIKSERYSSINELSGKILNQMYYEGIYSRKDYEDFSILIPPPAYWVNSKVMIQYDFFNDGLVDLFCFGHFDFERENGKFILIEDVNSTNPKEPIYYDAPFAAGGEMVLSDINNDGEMEIIAGGTNAHGVFNGGPNYDLPLQVINLNEDRSINIQSIGPTIALHSLDTGDLDNDGDIDIVLWPGPTRADVQEIKFPIKLINDGLGNFSEYPLLEENDSLQNNFRDWTVLNYNIIDLNNDGYVDVLVGGNIGKQDNRDIWPQEVFETVLDLKESDPFILWGNGNEFSISKRTLLSGGLHEDKLMKFYGAVSSDFDVDGDLDIITIGYVKSDDNVTIYDEDNYVIQLYENNGDKKFSHKTIDFIEGYEDFTGTIFSNFYTPIIKDIDNDGDFDLIAQGINYHSQNKNWPKVLYWENLGGRFVRKEIY